MHVVQARYCYRKSSVRPSVCLSVTLMYADTYLTLFRYQVQLLLFTSYPPIYVKKLHSLYKLCKVDFVVRDIKLQRSLLQNSNFIITLSVGFVLTVCNPIDSVMMKLEFCNSDLCSFISVTIKSPLQSLYKLCCFYINICCFIAARNNSNPKRHFLARNCVI